MNIGYFTSRDYVLDHVYVAVQKPSAEEIIKRPCMNLEAYLRVTLDGALDGGTYKVTPGLLDLAGTTEEELWDAATKNSINHFTIFSMAEAMGFDDDSPMYVATYDNNLGYGASVICFPEVFRDFCMDHDEESCIILPSSTMEMILLSGSAMQEYGMLPAELEGIVKSVNDTLVDPVMQLEEVVYEFSTHTGRISVVSEEV